MQYKCNVCRDVWLRSFFFFNDTATTEIYTLSLRDALPILPVGIRHPSLVEEDLFPGEPEGLGEPAGLPGHAHLRSEEHTSELQSRQYLVCRLLLEKKKQLPLVIILHSHSDCLPSHHLLSLA